jgi:hypothetical protein
MAWEYADRISDRIVDLLNAEMKANPGFSPVQLFAGQMLAMVAMLKTAEGLNKPPELVAVETAIWACLQSMQAKQPRH